MASNDMNFWDDDPDQRLRQRWQQTLANFEVEAHPSLGDRILNALPTGHRRGRAYQTVGLLLLLSVGLMYPLQIGERPYSGGNVIAVRRSTPISPVSDSRSRQAKTSGNPSTTSGLPVYDARPGESVIHRQPTVNSAVSTGVAVTGLGVSVGGRTAPKPSATEQARLRSRTHLRLPATVVSADQFSAPSVRSVREALAGPGETGGAGPGLALVGQSVRATGNPLSTIQTTQSSVDQPVGHVVPFVWAQFEPIGISPLFSQSGALPNELPISAVVPSHPVETHVVHRRRQWFVEGVPLNTFQWMSVPPVATGYLSQVKAPAAFSPATWGYQVSGGIRWQHWQSHLSLGQIRRWAYYTVNENRYRVVPRPDNPNRLVRETYSVAEDELLPMIGVGLSQETLLDRGRYVLDFGGQATYLPTGQQTMISLRGGVGRRLAMSRTLDLQIGLRAEYGLNRLLSEQQIIVIHPLLIGLGFRIQPRAFHWITKG